MDGIDDKEVMVELGYNDLVSILKEVGEKTNWKD